MFKLEFKIGDTVVNKTADNENEVRRLVYLFMTGTTVELEAHVKSVLNTQTTAITTEDKPKQKPKEQNIINNEKID